MSGQTVKTCLIKHRSNNWYKPLSKRGRHAGLKHVWYTAVQTNKPSPVKHENKRNVLSFWSNVWWPSNFIKQDQTQSNSTKQGGLMLKCLVAKHFSFAQALIQMQESEKQIKMRDWKSVNRLMNYTSNQASHSYLAVQKNYLFTITYLLKKGQSEEHDN